MWGKWWGELSKEGKDIEATREGQVDVKCGDFES